MLWACAPGTPTSERASRFQVTVGRTRVFVCCGTLTAASAKQATSLAAHNGHANYPRAATARRQVTCARARTHTPARCALPACLRWFCRTVPTGSPPSVARAGSMARRTITPCSPHASKTVYRPSMPPPRPISKTAVFPAFECKPISGARNPQSSEHSHVPAARAITQVLVDV